MKKTHRKTGGIWQNRSAQIANIWKIHNWRFFFSSKLVFKPQPLGQLGFQLFFCGLISKLLLNSTLQPCRTTFSFPNWLHSFPGIWHIFSVLNTSPPNTLTDYTLLNLRALKTSFCVHVKSSEIPQEAGWSILLCPVITLPYCNYLFTRLSFPLHLKLFEAGTMFCSLFYPQHWENGLIHSRCSTKIYEWWKNKNEWMSKQILKPLA